MSSSLLSRFSGLALIAGGMIGAAAQGFHPQEPTDPLNVPLHLVLFFGVVLVLLGLPGVLARQEGKPGVLGLIGGTMAFFGLAMMDLPHSILEFSLLPALTGDPSLRPLLDGEGPLFKGIEQSPFGIVNTLAGPLMLLGFPLLGAAILRACSLPRWVAFVIFGCTVGIVIALFVPFFQSLPFPVLLYLEPLALGYALLATKGNAQQNAPVRVAPLAAPSGD